MQTITDKQLRAEARRVARAALRPVPPLIPGLPGKSLRRWDTWPTSDREQAAGELAELLALPPGTERTRAYVRIFDRINRLVHATPTFPQPCDLGDDE